MDHLILLIDDMLPLNIRTEPKGSSGKDWIPQNQGLDPNADLEQKITCRQRHIPSNFWHIAIGNVKIKYKLLLPSTTNNILQYKYSDATSLWKNFLPHRKDLQDTVKHDL